MNLYNTSSEQIDVPVLTQVRIIAIAVLLTLILLIILSRCFLAGIIDAVLGWQMNFKCVDTTASINTQADTRIDSDSLSEENVFKCPVMMNGQEVIDCEGNINTAAININDLVSQMGKTFDGDGKRTVIVDENGVLRAEKMNGEPLETSEPEEEQGEGTGTGGTSFGNTTKGGLPIGSGGYSEYVYYDGKLQLLKTDGSTLIITEGNSVLLSGSYDGDSNVSLGYLGGTTKINGDEIILNEAIFKGQGDKMLAVDDNGKIHLRDIPSWGGGAQEVSVEGNELTIDGKTITLPDGSVTQTLTLNGNELSISEGNTVILPDGTGTQILTLNGDQLTISEGNTITIPTNTDNQTLSLNGNTLTITNGNSITLPTGGADNWGGQIAVTNATLIGNGTSASPLGLAQQGATSGQVLTWNGSSWVPTDQTATVSPTDPTITSILNDITTIEGDISTLETNVTNLSSQVTQNETDITTIEGQITTIEGDITTIQGQLANKLETVATDTTLDGDGTTGSPLTLAQQGATNGQVLKWNGSTWVPSADNAGTGGDNWGTQVVEHAVGSLISGEGTALNPLDLQASTIYGLLSGTGPIVHDGSGDFSCPTCLTSVDLTAGYVSGVLGIANGGTNSSTIGLAGSVAYSNGTAYDFSAVGTSGQVLVSGGTGAPTWVDASTLTTPDNYIGDATAHTAGGTLDMGANTLFGNNFSIPATGFTYFNSGNVGIGTATPAEALDVAGNVQFSGALMPGGLPGTTGQFLVSQGTGVAPTWTNALPAGSTVSFDQITSGTNLSETLTVGDGSTLTFTGTGIVNANQFDAGGGTTAVDLDSSEVAGVLGIANGGTNTSTIGSAGSIAYSTGTAYGFSAAGTSGQVLVSGGSGAPTWVDASTIGGADGYIGDVTAHTAGGTLDMGANTLFGNNFSIPNTGNTLFNSGQVGIRNSSPGYGLTLGNTGGTVADDGSIVAYGTLGTGDVAPSGAGTRMMWLPAKAAFRAGYAHDTRWDDANIGDYSTAMGVGPEASGDYSTAIGSYTMASGDYSTAMGDFTRATGSYSTAMGQTIEAQGENSFGIGLDYDSSRPVITDASTMAIMNGEVGIGTVSPSHLLHVNGIARSTQSNWATSSDQRVKQNITDISDALNVLENLRPVTFNYTDEYRSENNGLDGVQYGFIAQEVAQVMPNMVTKTKEKFGGKTIGDFHVLNTSSLTPLFVRGIQQQQKEITTIEKQIEEHGEEIDLIGPLLEEVGQEVQVVRKQVDEVNVRVDEQGQVIESQSSQLAEAHMTLDQFGNMIQEQQTDVATVEGEIAGVNTTLTNVQGQVVQASTDIESVRNEITNLQQASEEISNVQTEVETLSSQVTTDVTSINTDLTDMQARIAELETQVLGAAGSATIDVSTDSGTLVTADQDASFNTLTVTGQTSLYDLGVAGTLTAGVIGVDGIEGSINSLSADQPLKLQALGLSGIEMVGGKVAIDQGGSIKVKEGIIEVNDKMVGVETIEPGQDTIQVSRSWSKAPRVVNATPEYDTNVWIEGVSESGFTIRVKEAPSESRHIHWFAVFGTE